MLKLRKKNLRTYPNSGVVNFTKKMLYNGMLKLRKKNLRTYPNSAVVTFTKRCYTMVC